MVFIRNSLNLFKRYDANNITRIGDIGRIQNPISTTSVRTEKHYDPRFKKLRGEKVQKVNFEEDARKSKLEKLIEYGLPYPRYWRARPITVTTSSILMDAYKPPVGDGKTSFLSSFSQTPKEVLSKKVKEQKSLKKIKTYDPGFDKGAFVQEAQDIYVNAHLALTKNDIENLSEYVTETALSQMMIGREGKTIRWKFIKSLEPPEIVQIRVEPVLTDSNYFGQITVRFHTKQCLAIYDRFGRLMYGSEIIDKDVLEYAVFEKHLVNVYGTWRLHGKIIPEWQTPPDASKRTFVVEEPPVEHFENPLQSKDSKSG